LLGEFIRRVGPVVRSPRRLGLGLLYSIAITLCYTVTLWAAAHAVGGNISLSAAIIALSTSVLATTAIPSPGGIGVAELGAYGGLVAVGLPHDTALAAALLYRVCSFWLPLIVGSLALVIVTQRGMLTKPKTA
jgi:glycosyltransferase 2 family protein